MKSISFSRTDFFESYYGKYIVAGTKVDVMGDFRVKLEGVWVSLSDRVEFPTIVQQNSMNIPVSSLREQLLFYEKNMANP